MNKRALNSWVAQIEKALAQNFENKSNEFRELNQVCGVPFLQMSGYFNEKSFTLEKLNLRLIAPEQGGLDVFTVLIHNHISKDGSVARRFTVKTYPSKESRMAAVRPHLAELVLRSYRAGQVCSTIDRREEEQNETEEFEIRTELSVTDAKGALEEFGF